MGRKSDYTTAQKRDIVLAILRRDDTVAGMARTHGVSENTLHRWRDLFLQDGETGLAGSNGKRSPEQEVIKQLKKQLAERDQVIGELTIANRILKKMKEGLL